MTDAKRSAFGSPRWQRFLLQAVFIFVTVLLSLTAVTWVLQKVLTREALKLEASSFVESRQKDPDFPLPRTRNLIGYLTAADHLSGIPADLVPLTPGLHLSVAMRDYEHPIPVFVEDTPLGRLYLVFRQDNIDRLVGLFGVVPLGIMLILVYGASWVAYRLSARAVSPVLKIARRLRMSSAEHEPLSMQTSGLMGETRELALAVDEYTRRMDAMVQRERQFSADVSHELRTPVTIIDGAAQFLQTDPNLSDKGHQRAQMIRRACKDISELIDAFLILGREPERLDAAEAVDVAQVIESELAKLSMLVDSEQVELRLDREGHLLVPVSRKVFEIIIGNLCRNAIKYTKSGTIRVVVTDRSIRVEDSGYGISEELVPHLFDRHVRGRGLPQAGEGIGLNIVKRLCDLYRWDIQIANRPGGGVVVTLNLGKAGPVEPAGGAHAAVFKHR